MKRFYRLKNGYCVERMSAGKYIVIDREKPLYMADENGRLKIWSYSELLGLSGSKAESEV